MKTSVKLKIGGILLLVAAVFTVSWNLLRQEGPHGGVVKKAGTYFIEVTNSEIDFSAYLLNKKMKSITGEDIKAEAKFFLTDSTTLTLPLTRGPQEAYSCQMTANYYICKVMFNVSGQEVSAKFENPAQIVGGSKPK
jgi:hypothetical protein